MASSSIGVGMDEPRPIPGIQTISVQRCFVSGRGVVLAIFSRKAKEKHWLRLFEWIGW